MCTYTVTISIDTLGVYALATGSSAERAYVAALEGAIANLAQQLEQTQAAEKAGVPL